MNYYIFDRVPGYHPKYTFAVLAVSPSDARRWMRNVNKGGVYNEVICTICAGDDGPDTYEWDKGIVP